MKTPKGYSAVKIAYMGYKGRKALVDTMRKSRKEVVQSFVGTGAKAKANWAALEEKGYTVRKAMYFTKD